MNREQCFSLTLDISSCGVTPELLLERLAAAGCTDALVGMGVSGLLRLDFMRSAPTRAVALASAQRDIFSALPAARLLSA